MFVLFRLSKTTYIIFSDSTSHGKVIVISNKCPCWIQLQPIYIEFFGGIGMKKISTTATATEFLHFYYSNLNRTQAHEDNVTTQTPFGIQGLRFRILDSGFEIKDFGFWIHGSPEQLTFLTNLVWHKV